MMKTIKVLAGGAFAATLLLPAGTAMAEDAEGPTAAAYQTCSAGVTKSGCTTGAVAANSKHQIYIDVTTRFSTTTWKVIDTRNGVVVNQGSGAVNKRIGGVYSTYKVQINTRYLGGSASIWN